MLQFWLCFVLCFVPCFILSYFCIIVCHHCVVIIVFFFVPFSFERLTGLWFHCHMMIYRASLFLATGVNLDSKRMSISSWVEPGKLFTDLSAGQRVWSVPRLAFLHLYLQGEPQVVFLIDVLTDRPIVATNHWPSQC